MKTLYNLLMCFNCGTTMEIEIFRSTTCPKCGKDARVCKNCVFYSPGVQYDCREHVNELVKDKERSNFCDYFKYNKQSSAAANSAENTSRKAFDDLFK